MITGVIHLKPMPGDVAYEGGGFEGVLDAARRDFDALAGGGVDAIIIENFGSAPFDKGTREEPIPSHQVALMARLASQLVEEWGGEGEIGINCLRNDAHAALGVAAASGASFVRVNVHTGTYVTDQGVIEGETARTLRYRKSLLDTSIAIWADVLVKHASPLAPLDATTATKDCLARGKADAVIVTGSATGAAVDLDLLKQVSAAAGDSPVYLGSGVTLKLLAQVAPHATGAIVGTWFKRDGLLHQPVDEARVREFVQASRGMWRR